MMELTKERLTQIVRAIDSEAYDEAEIMGWFNSYDIMAMARQLLAGMEQEPVVTDVMALAFHGALTDGSIGVDDVEDIKTGLRAALANYAAPQLPQPAVVDADDNFYSWFGREWHENYQHNQYTTAAKQMLGLMAESAWKAGRSAAMLQGAEPVQGWIPCSERMPEFYFSVLVTDEHEDMVIALPVYLDAGDRCAFQLSNGDIFIATHWMPLPAAPQQEVHFKTNSDERNMEMPEITAGVIEFIGSLDNGFCHKHPDTPRLKHPHMQLMVHPPRPATYCPKCEPHVAEWEVRDKQLRKSKGV